MPNQKCKASSCPPQGFLRCANVCQTYTLAADTARGRFDPAVIARRRRRRGNPHPHAAKNHVSCEVRIPTVGIRLPRNDTNGTFCVWFFLSSNRNVCGRLVAAPTRKRTRNPLYINVFVVPSCRGRVSRPVVDVRCRFRRRHYAQPSGVVAISLRCRQLVLREIPTRFALGLTQTGRSACGFSCHQTGMFTGGAPDIGAAKSPCSPIRGTRAFNCNDAMIRAAWICRSAGYVPVQSHIRSARQAAQTAERSA